MDRKKIISILGLLTASITIGFTMRTAYRIGILEEELNEHEADVENLCKEMSKINKKHDESIGKLVRIIRAQHRNSVKQGSVNKDSRGMVLKEEDLRKLYGEDVMELLSELSPKPLEVVLRTVTTNTIFDEALTPDGSEHNSADSTKTGEGS